MTFLKGGARKRRDMLEPAIVQALRACGRRTYQVSGRGLPDLLVSSVGHPGLFYALEVKSGKAGKLTTRQGGFPVVHSVSEALDFVGVSRRDRLIAP